MKSQLEPPVVTHLLALAASRNVRYGFLCIHDIDMQSFRDRTLCSDLNGCNMQLQSKSQNLGQVGYSSRVCI